MPPIWPFRPSIKNLLPSLKPGWIVIEQMNTFSSIGFKTCFMHLQSFYRSKAKAHDLLILKNVARGKGQISINLSALVVAIGTLLLTVQATYSQNGKIIEKKPYPLPDSVTSIFESKNMELDLNIINFYRIVYLSDGLKVVGYVAEPKAKGNYPCIIANRGGNRDYGQWEPLSVASFLGRMASWGYVVVASQYRGNEGGEGKEELGGKDLNDVMNLVSVLAQLPQADTSKIGMEGSSRGGMMTYLALKKSCRFKAAAVTAGLANMFVHLQSRPDMEIEYNEIIPSYKANRERELRARSAVFWADQLCKTTPLLIMHGSSDWRVPPEESLELFGKLYAAKHPVRYVFFEGADHYISEFGKSAFYEIKNFFDYYVRDDRRGRPMPDMKPHGR
jgi:dipeptidyl aminopeptidase/acylaminoacyl peptidase